MIRFLGALIVAGICLQSSAAHAELVLEKFLSEYQSANPAYRQELEFLVSRTEDGMAWSNTMLEYRQQPALYCLPGTLVLTGGQLVDMLVREAEQAPKLRDIPVGYALLATLMLTFPCPAK
jgi:hypothetical protein